MPHNDDSNPQQGSEISMTAKTTKDQLGLKVHDANAASSTISRAESPCRHDKKGGEKVLQKQKQPGARTAVSNNISNSSSSKSPTSSKSSLKIPATKKDSRKLFVGGLSHNVTDEVFKYFFLQYGTILDSVVMMNRETGRPRGFGFVTFEDPAVAQKILDEGHEDDEIAPPGGFKTGTVCIDGKKCEVKASEPKKHSSYAMSSSNQYSQHRSRRISPPSQSDFDSSKIYSSETTENSFDKSAPYFYPYYDQQYGYNNTSQVPYDPYYVTPEHMMYPPGGIYPGGAVPPPTNTYNPYEMHAPPHYAPQPPNHNLPPTSALGSGVYPQQPGVSFPTVPMYPYSEIPKNNNASPYYPVAPIKIPSPNEVHDGENDNGVGATN